jgi:hypothetical protein
MCECVFSGKLSLCACADNFHKGCYMIQPIQHSTSHGAVRVQMAVNLQTYFSISLNHQLKINISNN